MHIKKTTRNHIEKVLKGWEQCVHALAQEKYGWAFDPVADLPRMLRAVGTVNFKTDERPTCELISMTERRCTPEVYKADKSSGRRIQYIDVEFNFIGKVILPGDEKTA